MNIIPIWIILISTSLFANEKLDHLIRVPVSIGDSLIMGKNYCDSSSVEGEKNKILRFADIITCVSKKNKFDTAVIYSSFGIVTAIAVLEDVNENEDCTKEWLKNYTGDNSGNFTLDEDSIEYTLHEKKMIYVLRCSPKSVTLELTKLMEITPQIESYSKIIIPISNDKFPELEFKSYWDFVVADYLKINKPANDVQEKIFLNLSDKDKFVSAGVNDVKYYLKHKDDGIDTTKK